MLPTVSNPDTTTADAPPPAHPEDHVPGLRHRLQPVLAGPDTADAQLLAGAVLVAAIARYALAPGHPGVFLLPTTVMAVGAVLLCLRVGRPAWLLIACGALSSLWFTIDWLTQTAIMAAVGIAGVVWGGPEAQQFARLRAALTGIGAGTYALAAWHKSNHDFLNPEYSCAVVGVERMVPFAGEWVTHPALLAASPHLTLAAELALAVMLPLRPRWALVFACLFHLPLTLTFEPSFPFVMGVCLVAAGGLRSATAGQPHHDRAGEGGADPDAHPPTFAAAFPQPSRAFWWTGALAWAACLPVLWVDAPLVRWDLWPRCALMVHVALWVSWQIALDRRPLRVPSASTSRPSAVPSVAAIAPRTFALALAVWFALGMTPYLGTRMQHVGAMLSNLRIDDGCWNHLFVPQGVRGADPYVRIDQAHVGEGRPDLEQTLTLTLWNPDAIHTLRRNWCAPHLRPLQLQGSWRGEPWSIVDLCDESVALPARRGAFGGPVLFPHYLRWQKNLLRQCPTACVH
jgi:hypothetical protein